MIDRESVQDVLARLRPADPGLRTEIGFRSSCGPLLRLSSRAVPDRWAMVYSQGAWFDLLIPGGGGTGAIDEDANAAETEEYLADFVTRAVLHVSLPSESAG